MLKPEDRKKMDTLINEMNILFTSGRLNISMTEPKTIDLYYEFFSKLTVAVDEAYETVTNIKMGLPMEVPND